MRFDNSKMWRIGNRVRVQTIPKGLRPPAQGCEERATLGHRPTRDQPQRGCGNSLFVWRSCDVGRNPVGVVICFRRSPRVARASQSWAMGRSLIGADSIPNVFFIPFDFVLAQQGAQLLLKSNLAMMLLLTGDVFLHLFEIRFADTEIRVATLPFEVGVIATAFLQPEVRDAFQFLHPFGLRDGAPEAREQMHVIFHSTDEKVGQSICLETPPRYE